MAELKPIFIELKNTAGYIQLINVNNINVISIHENLCFLYMVGETIEPFEASINYPNLKRKIELAIKGIE